MRRCFVLDLICG